MKKMKGMKPPAGTVDPLQLMNTAGGEETARAKPMPTMDRGKVAGKLPPVKFGKLRPLLKKAGVKKRKKMPLAPPPMKRNPFYGE